MPNTVTVTIGSRRTGAADRPLATPCAETIAFRPADAVPAGSSVALVSADGERTLAFAPLTDEAGTVALSLDTVEAWVEAKPDRPVNAVLAVSNGGVLVALVNVLLVRDPLPDITPPTDTVPVYPTKAQLEAILAELGNIRTGTETAAADALRYRNASEQYSIDAYRHLVAAENAAGKAAESAAEIDAIKDDLVVNGQSWAELDSTVTRILGDPPAIEALAPDIDRILGTN